MPTAESPSANASRPVQAANNVDSMGEDSLHRHDDLAHTNLAHGTGTAVGQQNTSIMQIQPSVSALPSQHFKNYSAQEEGPQRPSHLSALTLQLHPAHLELQFWQSDPAQRACGIMDVISLSFTIANHTLLMLGKIVQTGLWAYLSSFLTRDAANNTLPLCFIVPLTLLPVAAVLQVLYMTRRPHSYKQHRMAITVANRLVRLAVLFMFALQWKQHVFACAVPEGGNTAGRLEWLLLLKFLVAPHLIFWNHMNFWCPFKWSMPLQFATVVAQLLVSERLCVCHVANDKSLQQLSQAACLSIRKAAVIGAGFLTGGVPVVSDDPQPEVCDGVKASAQLHFYSVTVLLFIIPLLVLFVLELRLKVNFLRSLCSTQKDDDAGAADGGRVTNNVTDNVINNVDTNSAANAPVGGYTFFIQPLLAVVADSAIVRSVLVLSAFVIAWFMCEALVLYYSPMRCGSDGAVQLTWQGL